MGGKFTTYLCCPMSGSWGAQPLPSVMLPSEPHLEYVVRMSPTQKSRDAALEVCCCLEYGIENAWLMNG